MSPVIYWLITGGTVYHHHLQPGDSDWNLQRLIIVLRDGFLQNQRSVWARSLDKSILYLSKGGVSPAISNEDFRLVSKVKLVTILFGFGFDLIKLKFESSYCMSSAFTSETFKVFLGSSEHLESIYGEHHVIPLTREAKLACGFHKQRKNKGTEVSCVCSRLEITAVNFKPENFIT